MMQKGITRLIVSSEDGAEFEKSVDVMRIILEERFKKTTGVLFVAVHGCFDPCQKLGL